MLEIQHGYSSINELRVRKACLDVLSVDVKWVAPDCLGQTAVSAV